MTYNNFHVDANFAPDFTENNPQLRGLDTLYKRYFTNGLSSRESICKISFLTMFKNVPAPLSNDQFICHFVYHKNVMK